MQGEFSEVIVKKMSGQGDMVTGGTDGIDSCSDRSSHFGKFLTRGAFLLTPSHELTLDRAANILDKMQFRGDFSVTRTATGILFR